MTYKLSSKLTVSVIELKYQKQHAEHTETAFT